VIAGIIRFSTNNPTGGAENLLDNNHGSINLSKIRAFEEQCPHLEIRPVQDSCMMWKCLMNSVGVASKKKITVWKDQCNVQNKASGDLLLKIIIRESHLDANAATSHMHTKLTSLLDICILTIGCDITKLNGCVKLLVDSLAARGETTHDVLELLFKGRRTVPDQDFNDCIEREHKNYEEGHQTANPEDLMLLADNKFKLRCQSPRGWNVAIPQEEKIMALKADIKSMKKNASNKRHDKGHQKNAHKKGKEQKTPADKPKWMDEPPLKADIKKPFKPVFWKAEPWCCSGVHKSRPECS
jgi:hypothetical protein